MKTPPCIVIVEDDKNVAELLRFMFVREGFEPCLFGDGRSAEAYVERHGPAAAVVLDVMLPYRDGFAVATAIRADSRWKDVPIVMLTARAHPTDRERGRAIGVSDYIAKPFHPHAVIGRVKKLLEPVPE